MRKKVYSFFAFCILLCCLMQVSVSAYMPPPYLVAVFCQSDMPPQTAYVDLLLPLQENDTSFVSQKDAADIRLFTDRAVFDVDPSGEIAAYEDGYYSYLFHFADSSIIVNTNAANDEISVQYGTQELLERVEQMHSCKLAFVDAQGNILAISEAFTVRDRPFKDFKELLVSETSVSVEYTTNPYQIVFAVILCLVAVGLCLVIFLLLKKLRSKQKYRG